jgi:phosphate transport system substrate-binding protein
MMKSGIAAVILFLTACVVGFSCTDASDKKDPDRLKGRINISVDETFKPVIEQQIKVFRSSWPETEIVASYKSEADCLKDLQNDSTAMVIIARSLSTTETKFFKNNMGYDMPYDLLAFDAVTFIVNKSSNDSVFTIEQLSSYLDGSRTDKQVIVDNKNASGTVRYLMDSLLNGRSFGKNVVAAESSEKVIDIVAGNTNTIGVVGISWIAGREDSYQKKSLEKIKTALVECKRCEEGTFVRPSQATVTTGQYPFYRGMYYILKGTYGLGNNFSGFMKYERGQLIFRRAQLVPATMSFTKRQTNITEQE